jgi:hypothetical protein
LNRKSHTAWLALALFVAPLIYQSLHRFVHLTDEQHCHGVCQTTQSDRSKLNFAASSKCAVCEYELVLPGQTEPLAQIPGITPVDFAYVQAHTPTTFQQPVQNTSTRAPPAAS